MSSRCTIAYVPPIHIYECVNTYDKDGNFEVCISDVIANEWNSDSYNRDVILGRAKLWKIYCLLEKYFTPNLKEIEKLGFDINEVQKAISLFKEIENKALAKENNEPLSELK